MQGQELENLLRLLRLIGGKFILVEEGKPFAVILSYDEFQNLAAPAAEHKVFSRLEAIENVNREVLTAQLLEGSAESDVEHPIELKIEPLDGAF